MSTEVISPHVGLKLVSYVKMNKLQMEAVMVQFKTSVSENVNKGSKYFVFYFLLKGKFFIKFRM